jgi:hypothetical protein
MNCYGCLQDHRPAVPAVAVCTVCGTGVCPDHLVVRPTGSHAA